MRATVVEREADVTLFGIALIVLRITRGHEGKRAVAGCIGGRARVRVCRWIVLIPIGVGSARRHRDCECKNRIEHTTTKHAL